MKYRPDIDGLRAVAVMAVVLHHLVGRLAPGGFIGVDVFFVISGYLITKIIHQEIQEGQFSFARFYERRIRRLFPALVVVLLFVLIAGWFLLLPSDYLSTFRTAAGTVLFSGNIALWRELIDGYFAPDARWNPLLHMWSLGVEEQFYLVFPLLLIFIQRFAQRWLFWILLASFSVSLGGSVVLTPIDSVAAYFLLPTRAWEMLVGSLLAMRSPPQIKSIAWRESTAAFALLCIIVSGFLYNSGTVFPGYTALLPVLGAAALIWIGGEGPPTWVTRCLQLRAVVYVGLISYSLYLWHWPLIVFARLLNGSALPHVWRPLLLGLSFACAALSHRYVESFFRGGTRKTRQITRKQVFAWGAGMMLGVLFISSYGVLRHGYEGRVNEHTLLLDRARRPVIPFADCDGQFSGCEIGQKGGEPTGIVFWGDSHMLAWAPAFDQLLKQEGRSASLRVISACPAVFGAIIPRVPACRSGNSTLLTELLNGEFKAIVLASNWMGYSSFNTEEGETIYQGLLHTVKTINERGVPAFVIGPVPTWKQDVPLALALVEQGWALSDMYQTREKHEAQNAGFFSVVNSLPRGRFFDPAAWFCTPACKLLAEGDVPLYRDSGHLSVAGALDVRGELRELLATALESLPEKKESVQEQIQ